MLLHSWPAVISAKTWQLIVDGANARADKIIPLEIVKNEKAKCALINYCGIACTGGLWCLCAIPSIVQCCTATQEHGAAMVATTKEFADLIASLDLPAGVTLVFDGELRNSMSTGTGDNRRTAYVFHDKIVLNCSAAAIQASGAPMPVAAATVVPTQMVMAVAADPAPAAPASTSQKSIVDEIKDLAQMKADGLLSEDEFTAAKAKLMAGN